MGGRGASSGTSNLSKDGKRGGKPYGSQYHSVLEVGNIKFVEKNSDQSETLMETMTKGRVYVVIDQGRPKSIVYFDSENKRSKEIDLDGRHGGDAHVHRGYFHNENSPNGKPTGLLPKEKEMVERVNSIWDNHKRKQ